MPAPDTAPAPQTATVTEALDAALARLGPSAGDMAAAQAVVAGYDEAAGTLPYHAVPEPARRAVDRVAAAGGQPEAARILRLALIETARRHTTEAARRRIPVSVAGLLDREILRIAANVAALPDDFYRLDNDPLQKDLAIARLALVPCGAELLERRSGLPRKLLTRVPRRDLPGLALFVVRKLGGLRPLGELHADPRSLGDFNPDGWHRTYHRIAELLALDPRIRGVFGTAWFYDPKLAGISPHLTYLREIRERAGARTFCAGSTPSAVANALAKSKTRRKLYEAGTYLPTNNYLIWARQDLLAWAETHPLDAPA